MINAHITTFKNPFCNANQMKTVLLDTNFLLIPAQFKVDIFSEIDRICDFQYEIAVLDKTVDELNKIMKEQKGKDKEAAKLALNLLKKKDLKIVPTVSEMTADEILIDMADSDKIVATQDIAVRKAVQKKLAKVIFLKSKKHLVID